MIHSATFRNFKGLRDVGVDFERFTILVGPNASGKSSILQGLQYITRLRHEQPDQLQEGDVPHAEWTRGAVPPAWLLAHSAPEMQVEIRTDLWAVKVRVWPQTEERANGQEAFTAARPLSLAASARPNPFDSEWLNFPDRALAARAIPAAVFLRLDPQRLEAPSCGIEAAPRLGSDGSGLASALAYLSLNQPHAFGELKGLLRHLFPFIRDVRFARVKIGPQWGEQLLLDLDGAPGLPAALVSDGTLIVLGLLTAILGIDHPTLVLLDDLDRALHPQAQRELVRLLRQIQQDKPDLQIIATTHSPYLLDEIRPEEVRLTTRLADGSVACGRLDAHPEFERWKEAMAPGEFWSMVGERWVADRQPQEAAP